MSGELLLVKADDFEYRGETGANAARMAMDAEAGPGCIDIDWELVEYAEDLSKAVEQLEGDNEGECQVDDSTGLYRGGVESASDVTLTVSQPDEPVKVAGIEQFTITNELGRSNVEQPEWLIYDEEHPDGYVACPRCEYYPLDTELGAVPGEPMTFKLTCPWGRCGSSFRGPWESEEYVGDEAMSKRLLYERADKIP